jgi:hypothetical protein
MIARIAPLALLTVAVIGLDAKAPLEAVDVKTSARADYTAGATVSITGTAGELNVEEWDQPRVEATLERTEYSDAADREAAKQRLEKIAITVEKRGNDIAVELKTPKRFFVMRWLRGKTNATLDCVVMIPHGAKLVVRHQDGSVFVYGGGGDIDASARLGDIVLQLPEPEKYAIDARVNAGSVYADYEGNYHGHALLRSGLVSPTGAGAHTIKARVGIGGISIVKKDPVPAPAL